MKILTSGFPIGDERLYSLASSCNWSYLASGFRKDSLGREQRLAYHLGQALQGDLLALEVHALPPWPEDEIDELMNSEHQGRLEAIAIATPALGLERSRVIRTLVLALHRAGHATIQSFVEVTPDIDANAPSLPYEDDA